MSARALLLVLASLALRAGDGRQHPYAPPPIPHALHEGAACTDCHGAERKDGVPAIPHRVKGWCQACHVPDPRAKAGRSFPGPGRGVRATPGAPPALPHPVHMRENCQACHGRERHPGMRRNPHPGRSDCRSCHLP